MTAAELAREKDAVNSSPASGWATVVGFRVWCRGCTPDQPYRFQVYSDDCEHDGLAAQQALNLVLSKLPETALISADKLVGYLDRGGHFGSKNFVGGVLWQVARTYAIDEVHVNGCPCYHGKSGVDADKRHAHSHPPPKPSREGGAKPAFSREQKERPRQAQESLLRTETRECLRGLAAPGIPSASTRA